MENQLEKFDPSKLMNGVKDRIRSTFASLIPDEAWDQMVKKEVDFYFYQNKEQWNNNRDYKTPFEMLVRSEIEAEAKRRLALYLSSPDFETKWKGSGAPMTSAAVEEMVIKNSGEILAVSFGNMFSQMLQNFKYSLTNQR